MISTAFVKSLSPAPACPVCGGDGHRDAPELRMLDATCTACGWHFTSKPRRARREGRSR
jgi:hypothetical protein